MLDGETIVRSRRPVSFRSTTATTRPTPRGINIPTCRNTSSTRAAVDKPISGLLQDLKQRGLLEDTIVWWSGEFGRTPYAQKNGTGRDHNPGGFSTWLAGDWP